MRRWFIKLLALFGALLFIRADAKAAEYSEPIGEVEIPSKIDRAFDSAILIDITAGAVLYKKEAELVFSPTGGAVTLMTAYIVRQEADWGQEIPIIDGVSELPKNARKLDLKPGERWLVKDLAAGMLLHGAQDAALVLSDHISDSQDEFYELMNNYAQRLGMENTIYKNSLGAYASDQTTTVMDLMRLCEAALGDETLRIMLGQSIYDTLNGKTIQNRMEIMQGESENFDARVKGLGEGSTSAAGTNTILYVVEGGRKCLFIGYTRKDDQKGSEKAAITLLDHFLQNYELIDAQTIANELLKDMQISADGGATVTPAIKNSVCLIAAEKSIASIIKNSEDLSITQLQDFGGPVSMGDDLGSATLLYKGLPVKALDLIAKEVVLMTENMGASDNMLGNEGVVEIPVYTAADWNGPVKGKTFMNRYGSYIIIASSILLAGAVLLVAGRFRKKIR